MNTSNANCTPPQRPSVHFSGIGGIAMSGGARLAIEAGWTVRGSDTKLYPPASDMVRALGIPVAEGYAAENLDWRPDVVVIGNALSRGNPEVEAVLDRRMRYISLPEWIKEHALRARRPVVICGTHGKTTTTALTAHVLTVCGFDPGYFIGGQPLGFEHSARLGPPGAPFVIEGDEYDTAFFDKRAKFFHYLPDIAVVTSIEFDHGDIYHDLEEIERAFTLMLRQIPRSGWALLCADSPGPLKLEEHAPCQTARYGFGESAHWRGEIRGLEGTLTRLRIYQENQAWTETSTPLVGRHNLQNAIAAAAVAGILGAMPEAVAEALRSFPGVRRRMEIFLETRDIIFVDDFAHHPTAIRETIKAARLRWPDRRLIALFEPRSNTTVTKRFQNELAGAFNGAAMVWLGPIYRADSVPSEDRLDRAAVVGRLRATGIDAHAAESAEDIVSGLKASAAPGDLVLIMSNGAFGGIYARLREVFG